MRISLLVEVNFPHILRSYICFFEVTNPLMRYLILLFWFSIIMRNQICRGSLAVAVGGVCMEVSVWWCDYVYTDILRSLSTSYFPPTKQVHHRRSGAGPPNRPPCGRLTPRRLSLANLAARSIDSTVPAMLIYLHLDYWFGPPTPIFTTFVNGPL